MRFYSTKADRKSNRFTLWATCLLFLILGFLLGWKNIPGFVKANLVLLSDSRIWNALAEKNDLDTIRLDISFKNLQQIENKRKKAIQKSRLESSNEDFVKAEISNLNQKQACKVRLKGDLPDHWSGEKFSLRVEMKGDGLIKGMSRFSLQDPATRMDTEEWLFLNSLKKEGLMAVRYDFVNLIINGKQMGIYAIEEHFSKEMIEDNNRREGLILHFDDSLVWKKGTPYPYNSDNISWASLFRTSNIEARIKSRVSTNDDLVKQKETAINLLRCMQNESLIASKVFNADKLGKFLALTHIWNAEHGLGLDDMNFFFDPITCLLEPIGFDAEVGFYPHFCFFTSGDMPDTWVNFVLKDREISSSYIRYLQKFTTKEYISSLTNDLKTVENKYRKLILSEYLWEDPTTIWKNARKIFSFDPYENLRVRCEKITRELSEDQIVYSYARVRKDKNSILITLRNTTTQPIEIVSLNWNGKSQNAKQYISYDSGIGNDNLILPPSSKNQYDSTSDVLFEIPAHKLISQNLDWEEMEISVVARFWGILESKSFKIPVDLHSFNTEMLPFGKSSLELSRLPFEMEDNNKTIILKKGKHEVLNSIFIPPGYQVIIEGNTTLRFDENSSFVSRSPIDAIGSFKEPIIFRAANKTWPGFLISQIEKNSVFSNVAFLDTGGVGKGPNPHGIVSNGWTMTGGINIHESPVIFQNCTFSNFRTEDALNIISSSFILKNCRFSQTYSDAFDGDFVTGEIQNCQFEDIGGDGIDFSGSNAKITDCNFVKIFDKAISVGEASKVGVFNSSIDGAAFGVVSKDLSSTTIHNSTIQNITKSAFSAYQKKSSFGPAQLKVIESEIFTAEKDFLIQDDSKAWNNGKAIPTVPININTLYAD